MTFVRERLNQARDFAGKFSDDPDTQVGAVVVNQVGVVAVGTNRLPGDLTPHKERVTRPEKYAYIQHAELNAISEAAREGLALRGCKMYVTLFPCNVCAQAIIAAGITRLICPEPEWSRDSASHYTESLEMLTEAGVEIVFAE